MVRRGEWSVSTRYSCPSAIAVRAIASIGAPPSDHSEWLWQSPLSAARMAPPSPIGMTVVSSSFARYSGTLPSSASAMTAPVLSPDAGKLTQAAAAVQLGELVGVHAAHELGGFANALTLGAGARERSSRYTVRSSASTGSIRGRGYARPDMERFGFVGLPNAGKSSLYNALAGGGAGGAVRVRHDRPQRGHGEGARRPARRPGRDELEPQRRARHRAVRRHRRARRGGQQGRGAGQPLPRPHPRGRRRRLRAAGVRRHRRPRPSPTRSSTCASSSSSSRWPTSRPSRRRSSGAARPPRPTSRSPTRSSRSMRRTPRSPRARRSTAPTSRPTSAPCCARTSSSRTAPCSRS